jgi:hypoxanthine-guanine phosphoribosyltransferase
MEKLTGKRGICLVRASNFGEGTSTEAQIAMLHDGAQQRGAVIVDDIILDGMTGSLPGRREDLKALLDRKRTNNDFEVQQIEAVAN